MNKSFTFSRLCITLLLALSAVVNLNAQQVLSFVYSQVGSEDQQYNICNYFDKDKIILDSDFGYNKGKDDVCNSKNGGEIEGYIMCKNAATACSRQTYTMPASLTLKLATQCKDRGTYTAPTVTIDGQTANFGSVTFDSDFDKKELTATLAITEGTHDISVSFAGSDKFYVSTLTLNSTTPGPGPGPGPGPQPQGDCPDGTALNLGANTVNWSATYTPDTKTMSFTDAWAACGWDNMSADWTDYDNLYLKFNATLTGDFVMYINGTDDPAEVGKALAGADSLVIDLTEVTTVNSIMFKYSVAGDVVLPCMILREAGTPGPGPGPQPQGDCPDGTALNLGANNAGWSATYTPATKTMSFSGQEWAACGWTDMSADWTAYDNLYLKFNAALAGDFVMYINGTDDPAEVGKALAGVDSLIVDLKSVTTVNSIMFKYSVIGDVVLPCMVLREAGPATGLMAPVKDIRLVEVYTLTGARVARAASLDALPALERGAYVIRYNGAQCDKLVIR